MDRQISVGAPTGIARNVQLIGYPDQCPRCHRNLVPRLVSSCTRSLDVESDVEEAFLCTSSKCGGLFIAIYVVKYPQLKPPRYEFSRSIPVEPSKPVVGELVTALSPAFYETYSQALVAESLGMSQLTGIGLRKALEFLVKDYAVSLNPSKADAVAATPLAKCIEEFIDDSNTKAMATRAAWLGNDETHYVRRWETKDISDLKVLLRLTINGVENALLTKKYMAEMPG